MLSSAKGSKSSGNSNNDGLCDRFTEQKSLQEHHRESERIRHNNMNNVIRQLTNRVPGQIRVRETKIQSLRRVISYTRFLEKFIVSSLTHLKHDTTDMADMLSINNVSIDEEVRKISGSQKPKKRLKTPSKSIRSPLSSEIQLARAPRKALRNKLLSKQSIQPPVDGTTVKNTGSATTSRERVQYVIVESSQESGFSSIGESPQKHFTGSCGISDESGITEARFPSLRSLLKPLNPGENVSTIPVSLRMKCVPSLQPVDLCINECEHLQPDMAADGCGISSGSRCGDVSSCGLSRDSDAMLSQCNVIHQESDTDEAEQRFVNMNMDNDMYDAFKW